MEGSPWSLCEEEEAKIRGIISEEDASRIDRSNIIDDDIIRALIESGLFSLEDTDPGVFLCRIRAVARVSPAVAHSILVHASAWLAAGKPRLGKGQILALSVTEPGGGSDVRGNLRTTAERFGENLYTVSGEKIFTSNAPYASDFVVLAQGPAGPTLYMASKSDRIEYSLLDISGLRGTGASIVRYNGAEAREVGTPGRGLREALSGINLGRAGYGAIALGIADASLRIIISTGKSKVVFGRDLLSYQGIRWRIAGLYSRIMLLESLLADIASSASGSWIIDPLKAAVAKVEGATLAQEAAWAASQILGGRGLTMWGVTERMQRDARALDIGEGAREVILDFIGKTAIKALGSS